MKNRKRLTEIIILCIVGCGPDMSTESWPPDLYVAGIPVCGDILPGELDALERLSAGISALSYSLDDCPTVIFIRSPNQRVPRMCGSNGCCSVWRDCPDALGVTERVEGEGFSGLQRGNHIFVSRIGDREDKLDSLLAHEFSHWLCDCGHGAEQKALEIKIQGAM